MNLTEALLNQGPTILFIWLGAILLSHPERSIINATFGITFVHFWVYFVHRAIHLLPRGGVIEYINTHMRCHHAGPDEKPLPRWLELCFETLTDLGMNLSLLAVQYLIGYHLVAPSIILFFTLTYMTTHIVNYSIIGSETHRRHHTSLNKNFGPDTIDHIVGTNYDESFEDMTPILFNASIVFVIMNYIKQHYELRD